MRVTHMDTSSPEQRFGAQVRDARESRGWSQGALARHLRDSAGLELHQTAIARLERGERAIRLNEVAALAKLLGLDLQPYSRSAPALTAEEYERAQESLRELRRQEDKATQDLLDLTGELETKRVVLDRVRRSLVISRTQLEEQIREYEARQGG